MKNMMEYTTQTMAKTWEPWRAMMLNPSWSKGIEIAALYDPSRWMAFWSCAIEMNSNAWKIIIDSTEQTVSKLLNETRLYGRTLGAQVSDMRDAMKKPGETRTIKVEPLIVPPVAPTVKRKTPKTAE
jgi:hypothetical protein